MVRIRQLLLGPPSTITYFQLLFRARNAITPKTELMELMDLLFREFFITLRSSLYFVYLCGVVEFIKVAV